MKIHFIDLLETKQKSALLIGSSGQMLTFKREWQEEMTCLLAFHLIQLGRDRLSVFHTRKMIVYVEFSWKVPLNTSCPTVTTSSMKMVTWLNSIKKTVKIWTLKLWDKPCRNRECALWLSPIAISLRKNLKRSCKVQMTPLMRRYSENWNKVTH